MPRRFSNRRPSSRFFIPQIESLEARELFAAFTKSIEFPEVRADRAEPRITIRSGVFVFNSAQQQGIVGDLNGDAIINDATPTFTLLVDKSDSNRSGALANVVNFKAVEVVILNATGGEIASATFGQSPQASSFANGQDPFPFLLPITISSPLASGDRLLQIRAAGGAASRTTNTEQFTITLDSVPPPAPSIVSIQDDTGQPNDGTTNDSRLVIRGKSEANSNITVFRNGTGIGTTSANSQGDWVFDHSSTPLAEGSHVFTARAMDAAENTGLTSSPFNVVIDLTDPTVSIDKVIGQSDPTSDSPITFTVKFSEPVSIEDFESNDILLSGTAGATTALVVGGNGTTFDVEVSGMVRAGTVIAAVRADAAHDSAGNASRASTSTDNEVLYDPDPLTVTINQSTGQGDPTNISPISFNVVFSKEVTGFDETDVQLSGTAGATTVQRLGAGSTYTVLVSGMVGNGTVRADIRTGAAFDAAGSPNAASTSTDNEVEYDVVAPAADILDITPDPRNSAVVLATIHFTEVVNSAAVDIGDFSLTLNGAAVPLTGLSIVGSGQTYTIDLSSVTGNAGNYRLTLRSSGSGIADLAGNTLDTDAVDDWQTIITTIAADILDVTPDPRNIAVQDVTIRFSSVVGGVDIGDFSLTRNGSAVSLAGLTVGGGGDTYTLNLSSVTGPAGIYEMTLVSAGSGIGDVAGNMLSANASDQWIIEFQSPIVDILDVTPDPRNLAVGLVTVQFDEPVIGVDLADFALTRNGQNIALVGLPLAATGAGDTYALDLTSVTSQSGQYTLVLVATNSGIVDLAGNSLISGAQDSWTTDATAPLADIVDIAPDPRTRSVGVVAINFDEPVTGFDIADLTLSIEGVVVSLAGLVVAGGGASYQVNLSSVTSANGEFVLQLRAAGSGIADLVGNALIADAIDVWITQLAPTFFASPPDLEAADDTGRLNTDSVTRLTQDLTFAIGEVVADEVAIEIRSPAGLLIARQTAGLAGGHYQANFPGPLVDGLYLVTATALDGASLGVVSPPAQLVIDTTAPAPPNLDLSSSSDSPGPFQRSTDDITAVTNPVFNLGGAEESARVMLLRDGLVVGSPLDGPPAALAIQDPGVPAGQPFTHEYRAIQEDLAGNPSAPSQPLFVVIDAIKPLVQSIRLSASSAPISIPGLPIPGTTSPDPILEFELTEQVFRDKPHSIQLRLLTTSQSPIGSPIEIVLPAAGSDGQSTTTQSIQALLSQAGLVGQQDLIVRATDAAGNSFDSPVFSFFVFAQNRQSYDAPGTPVFSTTFKIDAAVRPWTHTFDKTTQTTWFTMEDGHRLGQFDPATMTVRSIDVNLTGGTTNPAIDPHGVFFDFNTHLTPRVWFVYRNAGAAGEAARVAYFDLATGELVTFDFDTLHLHLEGAHNIQVDDTGNVWLTAEHSDALLELDFDTDVPGSASARINSRVGRLIIHKLPEGLGDRRNSVHGISAPDDPLPFTVHGLQIVVDQRTGQRYVYLSDAGGRDGGAAQPGIGRVALLVPGNPATSGSPERPDRWIEWDFDDVMLSEGRLIIDPVTGKVMLSQGGVSRAPDGHALFLALDDNETPGIPEDDRIIFADGGRPNQTPRGSVRELNPGNVIRALQQGLPWPATSPLETTRISKLPETPATTNVYAAMIQSFVDREGNVVFLDAHRGIGRFHPDDPAVVRSTFQVPLFTELVAEELVTADIEMVNAIDGRTSGDPLPVAIVTQSIVPLERVSADLSANVAIDQYLLDRPATRGRGNGPFRGALNAGGVLYSSLAQSDNLTTTVFAETVRRQVEAVESKAALPAGATLGRLAFSVRRDGSLLLTGREDGSLLDVQLNLSQLVSGMAPGTIPPRFLLEGEPNAVIGDDGTVTLFAVDQTSAHTLVRYRFQPTVPRTMKKADFANPGRWTVTTFAPPTSAATGTLLVGEPTTFLDGQGNAGALATTEKGHLVLYRPHLGTGVVDVTDPARPFVFSSVAIVPAGNNLFVYGTDMAGDLVEYSLNGVHSTTALSINARILNETRPTSQSPRDTQVFQDVYAIGEGQKNHVFAGDGNARLVHFEIDRVSGAVQAENVTELARAANQLFGYFPFQQEFGGRVYAEIAPLIVNGELFVYGTNGQDLIEFRRPVGGVWQAANLSNDLYSTSGANRGGQGQPPVANETNGRFPANFVFGAPGAYVSPDGDRHILQINADGEIVEYYFDTAPNPFARFHTQNISLRLTPSASADAYRTSPGRPLIVPVHEGLLANDRDPSGLSLTARAFTNPANGTLRLEPDGSFTYLPNPGFQGQEQFTYEASNGISESKLITVTISVEQLPLGTILDDGNAGYGNSGSWRVRSNSTAVNGDFRENAKGKGKDVATWSLKSLPKNANQEYEILVHWVPQATLATDAPFVLLDNKTVVGGKRINQQRVPFGDEAAGKIWQSLGKVKINSGTLKVTLGDNANGTVVADAVRIVPVVPQTTVSSAIVSTTTTTSSISQSLFIQQTVTLTSVPGFPVSMPEVNWHNTAQPANVNNDPQGLVNAADLLAIVNWITVNGGPSALPSSGDPGRDGFVDVNGDGLCNTLDLLAVVNTITRERSSGAAEADGEGESAAETSMSAGTGDLLIELLAIDSLSARRKGRLQSVN